MGGLAKLRALLAKDIRLEARERLDAYVQLGFSASAGVLAAAAASLAGDPPSAAAAATVLAGVFQAIFTAHAGMVREALRGTLDGLRAAPVEGWLLAASKLLLAWPLILANLAVFTAVAAAFSPLSPDWVHLAAWLAAASLFLGAASAFVSASLSQGEARAGTIALLVLALSVPYFLTAIDPLAAALSGAAPAAGQLPTLWLGAAGFALLALALGGVVLE